MVKKSDPKTEAAEQRGVSGVGNAQSTPARASGITSEGAPPSNTAPANYSSPGNGTQVLRYGVDSLYLSYQGKVRLEIADELEQLKELAQSDEPTEQAKAILSLGDHRFEVRRSGSGKFPFVLVDNWFFIQVSRPTTSFLPMCKIQVSSELLTRCGAEASCEAAYQIARLIGVVDFEIKVHRIDLCMDFTTHVSIEDIDRKHWITRATQYRDYWDGDIYTGLTFGLGGDIACRLYNKSVEIVGKDRDYLTELWRQSGWNGTDEVWRLEFEIKRSILRDFGLPEERDVLESLDALWEYATGPWLRLGIPTKGVNKSRWPVHPMWDQLRKVRSCFDRGEPLSRVNKSRLPSKERMFIQGLAPLTTYMASQGISDPVQAFKELLDGAEKFHEDQGGNLQTYLARKVDEKERRYNVLKAPQRKRAAMRAYQLAKDGE